MATNHHGNLTATNQLGGIQEELQLLKGTVQTLVTLTNVVTGKVDNNAHNIQTLSNTVASLSRTVDSVSKKVDSVSKNVGSLSSRVDSVSKTVGTI